MWLRILNKACLCFSGLNIIQYNWTSWIHWSLRHNYLFLNYFFVFQILCKYSSGLFHLKIHSTKGWHLDSTGWPAIIASFSFSSPDPNGRIYELLSTLCICHLYTFHILILCETTGPIGSKLSRGVHWKVLS